MVEIFGYTFEHVTATPVGNPPIMYRVTADEGWYIRKPSFGENEYKTSTGFWPTDDLAAIEIVAEADLPEDAIICGGDTEPEQEVM